MSNRLKFFREQMAAFEGAVDPQRAIESGYYVPEPRKSVSELISRRVGLRPSSTHLLLGGIGSGKTTQLLVTRDLINKEIEDVHAYYVDVSLYTDISEISTGVLTAIAGIVVSDLMKDSEQELVKKNIALIQKLAYGYSERKVIDPLAGLTSTKLLESRVVLERHEGILTSKSGNEQRELIEAINRLDKVATSEYGEIILLLDGLDRIDDMQIFSQVVTTDLRDLSSVGIGIVLVSPLRALYSEYRDTLEQAVNYFDYQSCFDVENDTDSQKFFESVIRTRASEGFIEEAAIQNLIHWSGGVLRDLINLTQTSIEEAYLADDDTLQQKHIETSIASLGKAKILGLSDLEVEILVNILDGDAFLPRTDAEVKLLATGRVLEYRYPEKRYAVHPAILPVLQLIQPNQEVQYDFNDEF